MNNFRQNQEYVFFNKETNKDEINFQKLAKEREQPLKDIASFYQEARKNEAEAKAKLEADELVLLPAKPLSTDEQIQLLTKSIAELTLKLDGNGEK